MVIQLRAVTNNWTRPGQTLIDGNKIFTGDAYVDTLQIQGNAVTVTASAMRSTYADLTYNWKTLAATSYNHGFGGVVPGIAQVTIQARSSNMITPSGYEPETATMAFQLIIDGGGQGNWSQTLHGTTAASCTRFDEVSLPAGAYTIYLRARENNSYGQDGYIRVESASVVILGAKR